MNISVNNKQWTKIKLSEGFSCLAPQTQGSFYYTRSDLGQDISNLDKRLDIVSFSSTLGFNLNAPIDIWVLSTEDNGILSYETEIISGSKVFLINTNGGGGGGEILTFDAPMAKTGTRVTFNIEDGTGLEVKDNKLSFNQAQFDTKYVTSETFQEKIELVSTELSKKLAIDDFNSYKQNQATLYIDVAKKSQENIFKNSNIFELIPEVIDDKLNINKNTQFVFKGFADKNYATKVSLDNTYNNINDRLTPIEEWKNGNETKYNEYEVKINKNSNDIVSLTGSLEAISQKTTQIESKAKEALDKTSSIENDITTNVKPSIADLQNNKLDKEELSLTLENYVDLTTRQEIQAQKVFKSDTIFGNLIIGNGIIDNPIVIKPSTTGQALTIGDALNKFSSIDLLSSTDLKGIKTVTITSGNSSYAVNVQMLLSTKGSLETSIGQVQDEVNLNRQEINTLGQSVVTSATLPLTLEDGAGVNGKNVKLNIDETKLKVTPSNDLSLNIEGITEFVKTNGNDTKTGDLYLNGQLVTIGENDIFKLKTTDNKAIYVSFYNGDTRIGYFGKSSLSSNSIDFQTTLSDGFVFKNGIAIESGGLKVNQGDVILPSNIKLGYMGNEIRLVSDQSNTNKTVKTYLDGSNEGRLDFDLGNKSKIINVPNGVNPSDVINLSQLNSTYNFLNTKIDKVASITYEPIGQDREHSSVEYLTPTTGEQLFNNFVRQNTEPPREKRKGDIVITSDNINILYNGYKLVEFGLSGVNIASNENAGIIKAGNLDGELSVQEDGLAKVNGFDTLKVSIQTITQNTQANLEKINENSQSITTLKNWKDIVDPKITDNESKIEENTNNIQANKQEIAQIKQNASSYVTLSGSQTISGQKTHTSDILLKNIILGHQVNSSTAVVIAPDDTSGKTLTFGLESNRAFKIDLKRWSQLTNLKDPVNQYDASTKKYVDDLKTNIQETIQQITTRIEALEAKVQQLEKNPVITFIEEGQTVDNIPDNSVGVVKN